MSIIFKRKNKIIFLITFAVLLIFGAFFVMRNLNISGKKEIIVSQEKNILNQDEYVSTSDEGVDIKERTNQIIQENLVAENNSEEKADKKNSVSENNINFTKIVDKLVSWGYEKTASNRLIDTIIIHSSYNAMGGDQYSVEKLIGEYKEYGVSPHYLIDRKGVVYRLVEDKNIAYHAGVSKVPDGRTGVNVFSIGIEMMNTKDDKCTPSQYDALKVLISSLKSKYSIKYVLGHSDIAKGRKDDPWNFEWNRLK
jgi:N-acetyl-anhydromuramyl-L-alanine amidase AmpD